ncbi:Phage integrase SAM-like domain-containing protein [Paenimyroides ummariense]|uniref:Phage integrase SAM-like domain-containing protein n=1 Tax=Paenimyroides ummariense TaxID=913024 RepID=A0A1I4W6L2_9FLAO|nr:phage integrase SAM-like domain-containing protein [Paenimyroides ummariense]SFN09221.1 Phage integrase SAM-like domain-containing protein [Paenimyroides ummariense]
MATIKYFLRSKKDVSQIYVRFSISRDLFFRRKTDFVIDVKDWSEKTSLPKQNSAESKNLISKLNKLENYIFDRYNEDLAQGVIFDSNWVDDCINKCFNRVEKTDNSIFINYIQYIIDNSATREVRNNKIGLSPNTLKNYKLFKNLIGNYQKDIKKQIQFKDINKAFTDKFKNWLITEKGYSVNYAGRQFEMIKTVCIDAQKNDIEVTPHSTKLKSFKESEDDKHIQTLSFDELEQIRNTEMPTPVLKEVKKWILVGCYIGQRGGDLLNLTSNNLRINSKGVYVDVIQEKTKKNVTIGVVKDYIVDILINDFPKQVSHQRFNKYISKVCELAKINQKVEGYKFNNKTNRREFDIYPKHELITSHCFRRSFATNFYKMMPTAVLINITGHSTENMFLKYINQRADKDSNADLFMEFFEKMNDRQEPKMKIVKKVNQN